MVKIAKVLFPVAIDAPFDYEIPNAMRLQRGDVVYAPLGKHAKLGVVWSVFDDKTPKRALKPVLEHIPCRSLNGEILQFVEFTSRYNCAPLGLVLRMVLRSTKALYPSALVTRYRPNLQLRLEGLSPARRKVLNLDGPWPMRASEIAKLTGVSPSVIKGMAQKGQLEAIKAPLDPPFDPPDTGYDAREYQLTAQQIRAAKDIIQLVQKPGFSVALLDGVTGSGKTEVYLDAAAAALDAGAQVLILVPEIALTQAGIKRIANRFGVAPAQWHSAMGDAERRRVWREVHMGRARLVVGARSALYLPFADLGLIVVDEEHDGSFKQDEGVIYNARDMAVARGNISGSTVVLASATPSLESLHNARSGRYAHIILPERPGAAVLPDIDLVDLKSHTPPAGRFLSVPLIEGMQQALDQGSQAMLYLNRRGYAPLIICRACGERLKSPDTDSWLVEHRRTGRAICHHTGFSMPMPKECPACHQEGSFHPVGPGVERVSEEAKALFPKANIQILSSDIAATPEQIREIMAKMQAGIIDILVGTQMVVKGHNFPNLTFVGVVDGDLSLTGGDLRAGERTYQTLVQVAGRAGRANKKGHALIQTHMPEHEALLALANGDREGFIQAELDMREALGLPPYGRLAAIILSAPDNQMADKFAKSVLRAAPRTEGIEILGPSEPPIAILRGRHRRRFLIKSDIGINLSAYMRAWQKRVKPPHKVKFAIDIDPQGFM